MTEPWLGPKAPRQVSPAPRPLSSGNAPKRRLRVPRLRWNVPAQSTPAPKPPSKGPKRLKNERRPTSAVRQMNARDPLLSVRPKQRSAIG